MCLKTIFMLISLLLSHFLNWILFVLAWNDWFCRLHLIGGRLWPWRSLLKIKSLKVMTKISFELFCLICSIGLEQFQTHLFECRWGYWDRHYRNCCGTNRWWDCCSISSQEVITFQSQQCAVTCLQIWLLLMVWVSPPERMYEMDIFRRYIILLCYGRKLFEYVLVTVNSMCKPYHLFLEPLYFCEGIKRLKKLGSGGIFFIGSHILYNFSRDSQVRLSSL